MTKRNKGKAKQRKKKHLRKRIFATSKAVAVPTEPAVTVQAAPSTKIYLGKYTDVNVEYQNALDAIYGEGKVKPYGRYVSPQATLRHFCTGCSQAFYAVPKWMLGAYPHVCFAKPSKQNRTVSKSKKGTVIKWDDFYQMIVDDLSYQEIAKKMGVNPNIIQEYFISNGLI